MVCVTCWWGGTGQRHFAGTHFKPHKLPETRKLSPRVPAYFAGSGTSHSTSYSQGIPLAGLCQAALRFIDAFLILS